MGRNGNSNNFRWKRMRSFRQSRLVLLAIAMLGLIIGAGLYLGQAFHGNEKLRILGIIYILFSAAIFCVRQVLARVDKIRRKKRSRRH